MTSVSELHKQWSTDPKYRKAYEELEEEFASAGAAIKARKPSADSGVEEQVPRRLKSSRDDRS